MKMGSNQCVREIPGSSFVGIYRFPTNQRAGGSSFSKWDCWVKQREWAAIVNDQPTGGRLVLNQAGLLGQAARLLARA
jgi:hypothetical protein